MDRPNPLAILPGRPRGADAPGQLERPAPRLDPDLLDGQPHPASTRTVRLADRGVTMTVVLREWDTDAIGRCQLCEKCHSPDGRTCLILVGRHVPDDEAPLYDSRGCRWVDDPPPPPPPR